MACRLLLAKAWFTSLELDDYGSRKTVLEAFVNYSIRRWRRLDLGGCSGDGEDAGVRFILGIEAQDVLMSEMWGEKGEGSQMPGIHWGPQGRSGSGGSGGLWDLLLVPWPVIKPEPSVVKVASPNHWTIGICKFESWYTHQMRFGTQEVGPVHTETFPEPAAYKLCDPVKSLPFKLFKN